MKAILEFDLNDQDDIVSHYRCTLSLNMAIVLYEIDELLRSSLKYEDLSQSEYVKIENLRDKYYELMNDNAIQLSKILL